MDGPRLLLGFGTVDIEAGDEKLVQIEASTRPLQRWNKKGSWQLPSEEIGIEVGSFAGDQESLRTRAIIQKNENAH